MVITAINTNIGAYQMQRNLMVNSAMSFGARLHKMPSMGFIKESLGQKFKRIFFDCLFRLPVKYENGGLKTITVDDRNYVKRKEICKYSLGLKTVEVFDSRGKSLGKKLGPCGKFKGIDVPVHIA